MAGVRRAADPIKRAGSKMAAAHADDEAQLRELVLTPRAGRRSKLPPVSQQVASLVPRVYPAKVAAMASEACQATGGRTMALLLVREMAKHKTHRELVGATLQAVASRPEDLVRFLELYWSEGRVPLSAQVKKGLAGAFVKFDETALAGCRPRGPVTLRDVLFVCHAKPRDEEQERVWKRLLWGRLRG